MEIKKKILNILEFIIGLFFYKNRKFNWVFGYGK
jgi:hypothetical protein